MAYDLRSTRKDRKHAVKDNRAEVTREQSTIEQQEFRQAPQELPLQDPSRNNGHRQQTYMPGYDQTHQQPQPSQDLPPVSAYCNEQSVHDQRRQIVPSTATPSAPGLSDNSSPSDPNGLSEDDLALFDLPEGDVSWLKTSPQGQSAFFRPEDLSFLAPNQQLQQNDFIKTDQTQRNGLPPCFMPQQYEYPVQQNGYLQYITSSVQRNDHFPSQVPHQDPNSQFQHSDQMQMQMQQPNYSSAFQPQYPSQTQMHIQRPDVNRAYQYDMGFLQNSTQQPNAIQQSYPRQQYHHQQRQQPDVNGAYQHDLGFIHNPTQQPNGAQQPYPMQQCCHLQQQQQAYPCATIPQQQTYSFQPPTDQRYGGNQPVDHIPSAVRPIDVLNRPVAPHTAENGRSNGFVPYQYPERQNSGAGGVVRILANERMIARLHMDGNMWRREREQ